MIAVKTCPSCGLQNADWAKICKRCKASLPHDVSVPVSTKVISAEDKTDNRNGEVSRRANKRKTRSE